MSSHPTSSGLTATTKQAICTDALKFLGKSPMRTTQIALLGEIACMSARSLLPTPLDPGRRLSSRHQTPRHRWVHIARLEERPRRCLRCRRRQLDAQPDRPMRVARRVALLREGVAEAPLREGVFPDFLHPRAV